MSDAIKPPKDYTDYLQLEKILSAQTPWSEKHGRASHEEMLFIVVHQTYELWFKQLLHDLGSIVTMFNRDFVDEQNIGVAVQRLSRVNEIMRLLIQQIPILETMTPLDFLDFRNLLGAASGFQSLQYRQLEELLGIQRKAAVPSHAVRPSLFSAVERWLERTPFVKCEDFDFRVEYEQAARKLWAAEQAAVSQNPHLSSSDKEIRLAQIQDLQTGFLQVIDPAKHAELKVEGKWRLSYAATMAALFLSLYRDEPIIHLPFKLLTGLIELDEHFSAWRHRHSLLVLRMIGRKMGTGGSSGHEYLNATVEANRVFKDLFNLSSLLISRADLPILPEKFKQRLSFHFTVLSAQGVK